MFKQQSITDALTGIYNRLKLVNDRFGHLIGDELLKAFSSLLVSSVRESDIVGRWGGEEFLIICPDTDLAGCKQLAEIHYSRVTCSGGSLTHRYMSTSR